MLCSSGNENDSIFEELFNGRSKIQLLSEKLSNSVPTVAGLVDFDSSLYFSKLQLSGVDRVSQLAVAAAENAKKDSGIEFKDGMRVGCYFGTGIGGAQSLETAYESHFSAHPKLSPLSVISSMTNAAAAHIAMRFKITGPVLTYSVACASSAVAIGEATEAIRSGRIDCAIVGGAESLVASAGMIRAWQAMKTLATVDQSNPSSSCRPFSVDRSGLVLSEGSAALILESSEMANARGAKIYAEVCGYGLSCDANHIAKPDKNGQVKAMWSALNDAGIKPRDVGYINTHGTATLVGDIEESHTIEEVWGEDIKHLKVSSTKSMHGHLLGAAGALESALTVLSIKKQKLLPTAFCTKVDPQVKIPLILNQGESTKELKYAINNSFAFGGTNCVLVFKAI